MKKEIKNQIESAKRFAEKAHIIEMKLRKNSRKIYYGFIFNSENKPFGEWFQNSDLSWSRIVATT
jgi:hypothetical protein